MVNPPRHRKGGYVNPKELPKGPNGRCLCRFCGTEVTPPRKTFCSKKCVDEWMIRTGSGLERAIKKRDRGVCAMCRLDCEKLSKELWRLTGEFWSTYDDRDASRGRRARQKAALTAHLAEFRAKHGIPAHRSRRLWDIDHIVPVVEGGGDAGLDNLRTLCVSCHKSETSKLAARRAAQRRIDAATSAGDSGSGKPDKTSSRS